MLLFGCIICKYNGSAHTGRRDRPLQFEATWRNFLLDMSLNLKDASLVYLRNIMTV